MKVLIIIPPRISNMWIVREDKFNGEQSRETTPYTAPMLVALIKRELPEVSIELVEAQRDNLSFSEVKNRVDAIKPDLIITYMSWGHLPWDRKYSEFNYPTIGIILQQTIDRLEAIQIYGLKCEYLCKNEIEMPIIDALQEFKHHAKISETKGFIINRDGVLKDTGNAPYADLTLFPMPDFKFFDLDKYFNLRSHNSTIENKYVRSALLNTMKGCLYNCAYCGQARKNMKDRAQTSEQVINQILFLHNQFNVDHFSFIDNEFGVNIKRAKNICKEIIRNKLKIRWLINNRVELFDNELIELLSESGCENVRLGIETCDPHLQKFLNKKIDLNKAAKVIKQLKHKGINVHTYFIVGIPGETKKSLRMNAKFISSVEPYSFSPTPLFLMPNSILYNKLKSEGKLIIQDWSEYKKPSKLVFKNESYLNMRQIANASKYLTTKSYQYLFFKYLLKGKFSIKYCMLYFWNLGFSNVKYLLPKHFVNFFKKIAITN